jgi:hypothetical protein
MEEKGAVSCFDALDEDLQELWQDAEAAEVADRDLEVNLVALELVSF